MKHQLLLLIFFLISGFVFSQETVLLKGKIKADSIFEASVHIVNLTQKTGEVNSEDGNFRIKVNEKDTLLFSSVQYEIKEVIITSEIIDEAYLEVTLVPHQLEEVRISNISLSGNLQRDIKDIEIVEPFNFGLPKRKGPKPTPSERKLYTASSANVDLIINLITGRLQMLKQHDDNMKRLSLVEKAYKVLPDDFYTETLGLKQEEVVNFLHFCAETDPKFKQKIAAEEDLELIEYFQMKLPEFLKIKEGEEGYSFKTPK